MDDGLLAEKLALRARMMALREAIAAPAAGAALVQNLLRHLPKAPMRIAGFWPMGAEIDTRPALHALHAAGHHILLPVTPPRGQVLTFRAWAPGCAMAPGRFSTQHPADGAEAAPEWLLVPLLAFDGRGHRLGYGGGYYDRTLAGLPGAWAVGVAYAAQQVPRVPTGPRDMALHAMATEEGWITPA
jgi:5-formyltetrahydrofolate cyclo-ligase